jgi:antitoxin (DNA-binding transcriptional repressor) of toxin-antitoxin stability system
MTAAQSTTQSPQQGGDIYLWHGELVSFDEGTRALTVKAQVLAETEKEIARFKAGERILVTWSGIDRYAGAIRAVASAAAAQKVAEPFSLVAELASPGVQGGLVALRIRAADAKSDALKGVKPGEWVTVTARHRPASETQAVAMVDQYVKSIQGTN